MFFNGGRGHKGKINHNTHNWKGKYTIMSILDTASPDTILAAGEHISYLAQEKTTIGGGDDNFDGLNVEFSKGVERFFRVTAIAIAVAWAFFLVWHLGKPGGSRQAVQKMGGPVGIIVALSAVVGGLNVNTTMDVIDSALKVGWAVINTIKNMF